MSEMLDGVGVTKIIPIPRPSVTLSYAWMLEGRVEHPEISSMIVDAEEGLGCVMAW